MIRTKTAANEIALLGIFALFAALIVFVPWKDIIKRHSKAQALKYDFAGVVREPRGPAHGPATWRLSTDRSPGSGTIRLHVRHRYNLPLNDLTMLAEIRSRRSTAPVAYTVLENRHGGAEHTGELPVSKGDWIMTITGVERSQFSFRLEQPLHVK